MYTIGEISKMFNLPISTIRYYEKQGLLMNVERKSGIRIFTQDDINIINVIECLKKSGMNLKDINSFLLLSRQGDETISQRKNMIYSQKLKVEERIEELNKALNFIKFKCWYYDTACKDGTTKNVKTMIPNNLPPEIKKYYNIFSK